MLTEFVSREDTRRENISSVLWVVGRAAAYHTGSCLVTVVGLIVYDPG